MKCLAFLDVVSGDPVYKSHMKYEQEPFIVTDKLRITDPEEGSPLSPSKKLVMQYQSATSIFSFHLLV